MPTASAESAGGLPVMAAGAGGPAGQATTVLTSTSMSTLPAVTTTIQPMQSKDTRLTKLFVGGLPYHTTDKSLREHFEVFGEIEEAVVITDRSTGKSRGYGFVIMSSQESAERACKEPNPIIDGRKANVNLAILGAKPRGNVTASSLPIAALRPAGFPAILPSQYGDLFAAGQIGLTPGYAQAVAAAAAAAAAAAGGAVPAAVSASGAVSGGSSSSGAGAAAAAVAAAGSGGGAAASAGAVGPGKARSSMNLGLISGRQAVPAAATAASPYLGQLYAAAPNSPYVHPSILNLTGLTTAGADPYGGGTHPLLDFYAQYAAAAAAAGAGYPAAVSQAAAMMPGAVVSQSCMPNQMTAAASNGAGLDSSSVAEYG